MVNRTRFKQLNLRFTEKEYARFMKKYNCSKYRNYTDFILRTIKNTNIFVFDVLPFLSLAEQIQRVGTNINQIARVANTTQSIYKEDIEYLKKQIDQMQDELHVEMRNLENMRLGKNLKKLDI